MDGNTSEFSLPFAPDTDGDGVLDSADNCPIDPNSDQANNDGDSEGDACDQPQDQRCDDAGQDLDDLATAGRQPLMGDEQRDGEDDDGDGEAEQGEGALERLQPRRVAEGSAEYQRPQHDEKSQRQ